MAKSDAPEKALSALDPSVENSLTAVTCRASAGLPVVLRCCLACRSEHATLRKKLQACKDEQQMLEAKTEGLKDR